jgi:type I restriction enzyme, S subunit
MGDCLRLVRLREVLERALDVVELQPAGEYQQITVRLHHRGVFRRGVKVGSDIGSSRQYRASAGQLIVSRIDARNGAIGIVPSDLDGAIVTNDFWLFNIDRSLVNPRFLDYFVGTERFVDECVRASEGTTNRVRLQPDRFLDLHMRLPAMGEQQRVVGALDELSRRVQRAQALRSAAAAQAASLPAAMAHRLDLKPNAKSACGWRRLALSAVMALDQDPVRVDASREYPNVGIYSFGRGLFRKPPIDGATTSASTLYRIHEGQFIYSRLFAFEGAYGMVGPEYEGAFVSNEYPTFSCDRSEILPQLLRAYFQRPAVWTQLAADSKGLGDRRQRVPPAAILAHEAWIPPLEWQQTTARASALIQDSLERQRRMQIGLEALLPTIVKRVFG